MQAVARGDNRKSAAATGAKDGQFSLPPCARARLGFVTCESLQQGTLTSRPLFRARLLLFLPGERKSVMRECTCIFMYMKSFSFAPRQFLVFASSFVVAQVRERRFL